MSDERRDTITPARLTLDRNLVLSAGAGSGKTHALVTVALGLYGGAAGRAPP
jgi:ATP-dependent exoDNAse (exonuclease V) beta subunit